MAAKPKAVIVAGPTACGKSDLGIKLANEFCGEIISADSRQIYCFMNLGTGKVEGFLDKSYSVYLEDGKILYPFVSEGVSHWLLDILDPKDFFSSADFQRLALKVMSDMVLRNKIPFIVGGTGLYIRSLTEGLVFADVKIDDSLRKRLNSFSLAELQKELLTIDSNAHLLVDMKNSRRVQRALELMLSGMSSLKEMRKTRETEFDYLALGVSIPREELYRLIRVRLDARLEKGMISEVRDLINMGVTLERLDSFGLEYRYLSRFVAGIISYDEMYERLYIEICKFAKRQMTWFKKYSNIHWINSFESAKKLIFDFLRKEKE